MRTGTNLPRVRDYNEGVVLETVRVGDGVSRVEIAQATGLTAQTVSNIVKRLMDLNLIAEAGVDSSIAGRRRVKLRINPTARYAVGVQVDGGETSFVIIDLGGEVVVRARHPTMAEQGPFAIINRISESVSALIHQAEVDPHRILGVGVACPGPLDHGSGVVFDPPNLPGWHDVPLAEDLRLKTGYPVIVDNDATAAAIGEKWASGADGAHNFAFVYMGVGVGAGLFVDGHVYRGATTNAGEFGHTILDPEGPPCFCGSRGCVEAYCAPRAVVDSVARRLADGEPSALHLAASKEQGGLDFEKICRAALADDSLALEEVKRSAWRLGCGGVSLVNLLDLELIVLGGRAFRDVGHVYKDAVQKVVDDRIMARNRRKVLVELAKAGEDAGAVGAASLMLDATYSPRLVELDRARGVAASGS
jgi:predicted NBD/HSP70 family sugar kinase